MILKIITILAYLKICFFRLVFRLRRTIVTLSIMVQSKNCCNKLMTNTGAVPGFPTMAADTTI